MTKLTPEEAAHAASITDENPTLAPIPPKAIPKILVASVIRKPPEVIRAFLQTLAWQEFRRPTQCDYYFVNDCGSESYAQDVARLLSEFSSRSGSVLVYDAASSEGWQEYANTDRTRQWTPKAWHRVGALKDQIFQHALDQQYDGVWLVDADVMCSPHTLQSLMDAEAPIVSGVYWTFWTRHRETDAHFQHCGPQVWLRHPYSLDGRGWTEPRFREALVNRRRVRVWGLGACTLVSRAALEKGVRFAKVGDLPPGPMADGEDRHFCWRADALHLEMVADAWPNIYHAYHEAEYDQIPAMLDRLGRHTGWDRPATRDSYISARFRNLDLPGTPPAYVRGVLGRLDLLPEVSQLLLTMKPGDRVLRKIHFPAHYPEIAPPFPQLGGTSCIMEFTLLDVQDDNLPPTIDQEILRGTLGNIDPTTLTERQLDEVLSG